MMKGGSEKYDRQLRLWETTGQENLENSHICVLGSSVALCETLKNLILPGIGQFTIIDDKLATDNDVHNNFFLNAAAIGKPIVEELVLCLNELNPDVSGHSLVKSKKEVFVLGSEFWGKFDLVISDSFDQSLLDSLWKLNIPLVHVVSVGFYAYVRVYKREHCIVETHPSSLIELRVDHCWPQLQHHVDSIDLTNLNEVELSKVPYVILLIKALKQCQLEGNVTRQALKAALESFRVSDGIMDLNFEEASKKVYEALRKTEVPDSVRDILKMRKKESSSQFWVLIGALQRFIDIHGVLPLSGVLPDMDSDTESYITLQNIYREKAAQDQETIFQFSKEILKSKGLDESLISQESVKVFCKNARFIHVSLGSNEVLSKTTVELIGNESTHAYIWFALQLVAEFISVNNRPPVLHEIAAVKELRTLGMDLPESFDDYLREMYVKIWHSYAPLLTKQSAC